MRRRAERTAAPYVSCGAVSDAMGEERTAAPYVSCGAVSDAMGEDDAPARVPVTFKEDPAPR
jgi:hypothetical protein